MKLISINNIKHWLQQPTTLSGLSMLVGGAAGLWTGSITQDCGYTLMGAAIPLLLPDNTTARRIGQAALLPLVDSLSQHGTLHSRANQKLPPDA